MSDDKENEFYDLRNEAEGHLRHGHYGKAFDILKYILIRYSDNDIASEYANARLGEALLMHFQFDQGMYHITKALSHNPNNPICHFSLGFLHYSRNEFKKAVQEYRRALDADPGNREYLRVLGEAAFSSGDKEAGLAYLLKALPFYPGDSGILVEVATAYMLIGDMISAIQYSEDAVRANPDDIMAHAVLRKIKGEAGGIS